MAGRYRAWVVVINNPEDNDIACLIRVRDYYKDYNIRYAIFGNEVGENGTPHLQGYISFDKAKTFKWVKELTGGRAHIEQAKGNDVQNGTYCSKEGSIALEVGEKKVPGKRNDLIEIRQAIALGAGVVQLIEDDKVKNYQQIKIAEVLLKYMEAVRDWQPEVIWIYGPSGCGKSRLAHEMTEGERRYVKMSGSGKWWDGYDAHKFVILDDFRDSHMAITDLLGLLDRYACRVESKGGSRQFLATKIVITSILPPDMQYLAAKGEPTEQILRRITKVIPMEAAIAAS